MRTVLYPLVTILLIFSCQNEKSVRSIVHRFEEKFNTVDSWEYDIHYKMKYFSSDEDTLNYYSNCRLIRHEADTIFGGSFWISNDSIDRYYDLSYIYVIDHTENKITRYFPHQGQDWAVKGNTISGVLNSYFFKPNRLSEYLADSTTTVSLMDTTIQSKPFSGVEFKFADELPIEKQKKTFYFTPDNNLKHIIYSVKFQNQWQYNEWHFNHKKYNQTSEEHLRSEFDSLAKMYTLEDYQETDPKLMEPLAAGLEAPDFRGFNFQTNDSIQLKDYKEKIVILDFWYKDCYPCIKAIPYLSSLRDKYSKKELIILGLNPFDSKEENRKKLPEFIEINEMNYPTVFIDNQIQKDYNVKAFPTFYIIDQAGKILFSKVGYSEENDNQIDSLLNTIL